MHVQDHKKWRWRSHILGQFSIKKNSAAHRAEGYGPQWESITLQIKSEKMNCAVWVYWWEQKLCEWVRVSDVFVHSNIWDWALKWCHSSVGMLNLRTQTQWPLAWLGRMFSYFGNRGISWQKCTHQAFYWVCHVLCNKKNSMWAQERYNAFNGRLWENWL